MKLPQLAARYHNMENEAHKRGTWIQSPPRDQMVSDVKALDPADRVKRLSIAFGKPNHIDDEAVVTLTLDAWHSGDQQGSQTFAAELLRRVTKHVRAHARRNPGWGRLGGGESTAVADFCQDTVLAILSDEKVPSHAEARFGQYVHRRCLDAAAKLYAKKHSAGSSLDDAEDGDFEAQAREGDPAEPLAESKSPEDFLIEIEEFLKKEEILKKVPGILQQHVPELPQIAFTYRFYGELKIESKDEVCVTKLMGLTEKTVTKYINQAIAIIKQRLKNDQ
jgi:DNA-directed RNA polymerase specialized sigma24 family protein